VCVTISPEQEIMVVQVILELSFSSIAILVSVITAVDVSCSLRLMDNRDPILRHFDTSINPYYKVTAIGGLLLVSFAFAFLSLQVTQPYQARGSPGHEDFSVDTPSNTGACYRDGSVSLPSCSSGCSSMRSRAQALNDLTVIVTMTSTPLESEAVQEAAVLTIRSQTLYACAPQPVCGWRPRVISHADVWSLWQLLTAIHAPCHRCISMGLWPDMVSCCIQIAVKFTRTCPSVRSLTIQTIKPRIQCLRCTSQTLITAPPPAGS
jgi:hypothetical protein